MNDEMLSVSEVAQRLRISTSMVHKIVGLGLLRSIRVGSLHRIRLDDLQNYIETHRNTPKSAT